MSAGTSRTSTAVTVTIARDPALVRTVRLVAASVARRTGSDEEFVEEVRLAAGEACALFLVEPGRAAPDPANPRPPVTVAITLDDGLQVDVSTRGSVELVDHPDSDIDGVEAWALLRGLIEDFSVDQTGDTTTVSMRWPLP
jgi:hypothetical protein